MHIFVLLYLKMQIFSLVWNDIEHVLKLTLKERSTLSDGSGYLWERFWWAVAVEQSKSIATKNGCCHIRTVISLFNLSEQERQIFFFKAWIQSDQPGYFALLQRGAQDLGTLYTLIPLVLVAQNWYIQKTLSGSLLKQRTRQYQGPTFKMEGRGQCILITTINVDCLAPIMSRMGICRKLLRSGKNGDHYMYFLLTKIILAATLLVFRNTTKK